MVQTTVRYVADLYRSWDHHQSIKLGPKTPIYHGFGIKPPWMGVVGYHILSLHMVHIWLPWASIVLYPKLNNVPQVLVMNWSTYQSMVPYKYGPYNIV